MFEVYTTVPGLVMQIGTFGYALNEGYEGDLQRAVVPDDVAARIEDEIRGFRVEEQDDPDRPGKKKRVEVKFAPGTGRPDGREVRLRLKKVEETTPALKAGKTAPPPAAGQGEKKEL